MKIYEQLKIVSTDDIDELNHVNNVRYVQWIQDMAQGHWEAVAPKDFSENYIWVVAAHHIYYKGECFAGDTLLLKTYIESNKGVISHRKVDIYKDEKLILTATTEWCLLTIATKRPTRIPKEIDELFLL
ncbi:acyl-CoA thioesterase [Neptunitalea lumnitzerae]|uniref:Thioesterase n=1 Tax=Neptunitalea lumnitzerae TaxID=2965509 RepID=A0ABQ5MIG3_9FLAO|nr:thioesterase family protein [Neptunitalea sp. Y10]GLB49221.1 thioesterase [Neptunitalea sp. Y10]